MDSDKYAFWGIALKPGEPADLELQDGETLHVTMASYGVELKDTRGRSVVTATVHESDEKHGLAVLNAGVSESRVMDVSFIGEESITFEVSGKNVVHLVGNFSFEDDVDDGSDSDEEGNTLIGVYDDQDVDSDDDGDDEEVEPQLLPANDAPVITEICEDDDEDEKRLTKKDKKERLPNGKHKAAPSEVKPKDEKDAAKPAKQAKKRDERNVSFRTKHAEKKDKGEKQKVEDEQDKMEIQAADKDDTEEEDDRPDQKIRGPLKAADLHQGDDDAIANESADSDEIKPEKPKPQATPRSAGHRNRKRRQANAASEEATPQMTKKSKVSQRPATPAAVKGSQKPAKAETAEKPGKTEIEPTKDGKSGKQANGSSGGKDVSGMPVQDRAKGPGDSPATTKSQKKKKKRNRRNSNAS